MTSTGIPRPTLTTTGAPCWLELLTRDVGRARRFYGELFGWTGEDLSEDFGGYSRFRQSDGSAAAGCMPIIPGVTPGDAGWAVYLATDDAAAALTAAEKAGATVRHPAHGIGDLGIAAFLADPGGAAVGLWQAGTFAGFGSVGFDAPHGAPCYAELHTARYDDAVAFYREVLGWDAVARPEVPGISYTTLGPGDVTGDGGPLAGILDASAFLGEGETSSWNVYFVVNDVDQSSRDLIRLGGSVLAEAVDTPFGRQAFVADPDGARFKLHGPHAA